MRLLLPTIFNIKKLETFVLKPRISHLSTLVILQFFFLRIKAESVFLFVLCILIDCVDRIPTCSLNRPRLTIKCYLAN